MVRTHVTYHRDRGTRSWWADSEDQPTLHATGPTFQACRDNVRDILDRLLPDGYRIVELIGPDQPSTK